MPLSCGEGLMRDFQLLAGIGSDCGVPEAFWTEITAWLLNRF
jgi:hypothetical protein